MRPIKASEISSFLYCHRSWWYSIKGYQPQDNQRELASGLEIHHRHGRQVLSSGLLRLAAYLLLLTGIIALTVYLTKLLL